MVEHRCTNVGINLLPFAIEVETAVVQMRCQHRIGRIFNVNHRSQRVGGRWAHTKRQPRRGIVWIAVKAIKAVTFILLFILIVIVYLKLYILGYCTVERNPCREFVIA